MILEHSNQLSDFHQIVEEHKWRFEEWREACMLNLGSEFLFCLLGGYGITFEMNTLAYEWLASNNIRSILDVNTESEQAISNLLKSIPANRATTLSFRYPNMKARRLCEASNWLGSYLDNALHTLFSLEPKEARAILIQCPGFGLKTASWYLRNVGHGEGLAILDVHVIRLGQGLGVFSCNLTAEKHYIELESELVEAASQLEIRMENLDLLLWSYARGSLNEKDGQYRLI